VLEGTGGGATPEATSGKVVVDEVGVPVVSPAFSVIEGQYLLAVIHDMWFAYL